MNIFENRARPTTQCPHGMNEIIKNLVQPEIFNKQLLSQEHNAYWNEFIICYLSI